MQCLGLLILMLAISLAVVYWPVTLTAVALWIAVMVVSAYRDGQIDAMVTRAIAQLSPTPGRTAGPLRWRTRQASGILELTGVALIETTVARSGRPCHHVAVVPRDRIMRVEKRPPAKGQKGPSLHFMVRGGNLAYPDVRGDTVPLLSSLDVPVTENGVRWTRGARIRSVSRRARPSRCLECGAPLRAGEDACPYCRHAVA